MPKKFIRKIKIRKGVLSKQLGIPEKKKIPMALLDKIINSKAGQVIKNPTKTGRKVIKVTSTLERRSILARNLKKIRGRKK